MGVGKDPQAVANRGMGRFQFCPEMKAKRGLLWKGLNLGINRRGNSAEAGDYFPVRRKPRAKVLAFQRSEAQQALQPRDRRREISVVQICPVSGRFKQERRADHQAFAQLGQRHAHLLQKFDAGVSWPDEACDEHRRYHADADLGNPGEGRAP